MKNEFYVNVMNKKDVCIKENTTFKELSLDFSEHFSSKILIAMVGNVVVELFEIITPTTETITFFDLNSEIGSRAYISALHIILLKASKNVLGENAEIVIEHSLQKNHYCELHSNDITLTEEILIDIEDEMKKIVELDFEIEKLIFNKVDALKIFEKQNMIDKLRLLKYSRSSTVILYKLDDFYDYFYNEMPPSTGLITHFRLKLHEKGFLVINTAKKDNVLLEEDFKLKKISSVFMEQLKWCRLMNVKQLADVNKSLEDGSFWDLVAINEALHEKKVAQVADLISHKIDAIKTVFIAGPSSSGKTTFANRLSIQLRVLGITPHIISLDNYFVNKETIPFDEFGKLDFENLTTIDIKQFNEDFKKLIDGFEVELPHYNFLTGKREYNGDFIKLKEGDIFIIEGIHCLNPKLSETIPHENKFNIFISAMTQLNIDNHNSISSSDSRLLRRMVRDNFFRGTTAKETISMWPYVTRGETKNIFPFQENADAIFNSTTVYETNILKQFVEPQLLNINSDEPEFVVASRLLKILECFLCADTAKLPSNSIIREFVGV